MTPIQRTIGTFVIVLCGLIGGTLLVAKFTTDHLLHQYATSVAHRWANYLATSVTDLEAIAAGEDPTPASMEFFYGALKPNQVFRYEIFNREGHPQLVSDQTRIGRSKLQNFSPDAARAIQTGHPVVASKHSVVGNEPSYFAVAYVPVVAGGRTIGAVAAYVDQTGLRDEFFSTFLIAAAALCVLSGLSFSIPAIAWYRRSKEKQEADRRVAFLAHHDELTGLTNRNAMTGKLWNAITGLRVKGNCLAVHFIDVDRFKEINTRLGRQGGDFLLKTIAERLRAVTRREDLVSRVGPDEFVVMQNDIHHDNQVAAFAQRLVSALSAPFQFVDHEICVAVSIGIAVAPKDGQTPERLLRCADLALQKAKAKSRHGYRFFGPEMDSELQARIELERRIRHAILHDGFTLHFQPLFEVSTRSLVGFEALIRMSAEDGSLIPPMKFIPLAEEIGMIGEIGAWVLQEACRIAMNWPDHLTVAVNLSAAQFDTGSVSEMVAAALKKTGLAPHRLELEITETLLLGDTGAVMDELRSLKAMGVQIAMDDFGTGYSSLSSLWRFPFDKIKIDRSFTMELDGSGTQAELVMTTIIALGLALKMLVTVEGVETEWQAAWLDDSQADHVQGYFFGRPVPAQDVAATILADLKIPIQDRKFLGCPEPKRLAD